MLIKVFLDDLRKPFKDFQLVKNYDECIKLLDVKNVEIISLDHDLGTKKSGYDVAMYMVKNNIYPKQIYIHSANPVGAQNIYELINRYKPEYVELKIISYVQGIGKVR